MCSTIGPRRPGCACAAHHAGGRQVLPQRSGGRRTPGAIAAGGRPGLLEWLPQENIFYPGAAARLSSIVRLSSGARFIGWEISCLGAARARSDAADPGSCASASSCGGRPAAAARAPDARCGVQPRRRWGLAGHVGHAAPGIAFPAGSRELAASARGGRDGLCGIDGCLYAGRRGAGAAAPWASAPITASRPSSACGARCGRHCSAARPYSRGSGLPEANDGVVAARKRQVAAVYGGVVGRTAQGAGFAAQLSRIRGADLRRDPRGRARRAPGRRTHELRRHRSQARAKSWRASRR